MLLWLAVLFLAHLGSNDLDMVSMLFESDSSNFSEHDDVNLSDPEATMQYACDEEQKCQVHSCNIVCWLCNII